jgi:hypothetical protein
MKDKEKQILKFSVIDNKTGEYPDLYNIALKEDWAKDLMYCDMEGFSINEDGQLILSDECGKFVYCPSDRFTVVFEDRVVLSKEEYNRTLEKFRKEIITLSQELVNSRNETAEKIYRMADEICTGSQNDGDKILAMIKDTFGVEIKE